MNGLMVDIASGAKCYPWRVKTLFSGSGAELTALVDKILAKVKNKEICPICGGVIVTGELTDCTKDGGGRFPLECVVCNAEIETEED